ncbi:hypothetical protein SAMN02746019_00026940 [Thermoflexus hugenholtzii JAD2]|uniref:Uncharacterized protein n=2 Tax=Thermoflexus TaxID=1495649 RepID=A0A212QPK1_9CHLR|nr:hypothetical protein SAMN02746019_00026940 [Thermoflexus hugenholtzii JAD2]
MMENGSLRKSWGKIRQGSFLRRLVMVALILSLGSGCREPSDRPTETVLLPGEIAGMIRHAVQTPTADWGLRPHGVGIGFVWPEHRSIPPLQRPQTEEITLAPGQPFAPYLVLSAAEPITVLVTMILDYRQVPFELNGKYGLLHLIPLTPGGDIELPMRVDVPGEGLHDLIAIAFLDPLNFSTDWAYRLSMDQRLVGRRARIRVGHKLHPARWLPPPIPGASVPPWVNLSLKVALVRPPRGPWDHPSRPGSQLTVVQGKAGRSLPLAVWASNLKGEKGADYAMLFFWNYRQIPFRGEEVIVARLEPDTEIILEGEIQLPAIPGIYQMQVVYVFDPYRSIRNKEVRAPFVFGSPRIAIQVADP